MRLTSESKKLAREVINADWELIGNPSVITHKNFLEALYMLKNDLQVDEISDEEIYRIAKGKEDE